MVEYVRPNRLLFYGLPIIYLILVSCQTVPITGREQISLIPSQQINAMSLDAYSKFTSEHQVVRNTDEERIKAMRQFLPEAVKYYQGTGES